MMNRSNTSTIGLGGVIGAVIGGIPGLIVGGAISCILSSADALPSKSKGGNGLPPLPPLPELPGFNNRK